MPVVWPGSGAAQHCVDGGPCLGNGILQPSKRLDRVKAVADRGLDVFGGVSDTERTDRARRTLQSVDQRRRIRGQISRRPSRPVACAENIASTSRVRLASPSVIRSRCPLSIGPSSGASGGDGIHSIRSRSSDMPVTRNPLAAGIGSTVSPANHGIG